MKKKTQAVSLAIGGFLAIILGLSSKIIWSWTGFIYSGFAMMIGFINWIEIDKRSSAISRNHSQGTKTFYTEQDESSSSDERKPVSEEDGKSDPFLEEQKPDTQIKREEKKA